MPGGQIRGALEEGIEERGQEGANDVSAGNVAETVPEGAGGVFPQGKEKPVGGRVLRPGLRKLGAFNEKDR